jgi:rubrerythrin
MNAILNKSYDLERRGLDFYISSAVKSGNLLVKRTLFSLAQEEIQHMMKIDEISSTIDNDGKWPDTGFKASDIEISIKDFFEKVKLAISKAGKDEADVIKEAMEFERKSYELYSDLENKGSSDNEKYFYGQLKKQEEKHYEALENVYHYLSRTGDWFEREESKAWNWMNL